MNKKIKNNSNQFLEILKVITNIILIILIAIFVYAIFNYTVEVNEALSFEEPDRLIKIYEERTGKACVCYSDIRNAPIYTNEIIK